MRELSKNVIFIELRDWIKTDGHLSEILACLSLSLYHDLSLIFLSNMIMVANFEQFLFSRSLIYQILNWKETFQRQRKLHTQETHK